MLNFKRVISRIEGGTSSCLAKLQAKTDAAAKLDELLAAGVNLHA